MARGLSLPRSVCSVRIDVAGRVTCEEYAAALVKRARHHRALNQWCFGSYARFGALVAQARALDARAARDGVDALAPLYGLPIPMKGTAAVKDYPSGGGVGILSGYVPKQDSALTKLIKKRNGLIFGTTNVPPFAASYRTAHVLASVRQKRRHRETVYRWLHCSIYARTVNTQQTAGTAHPSSLADRTRAA